MMVSDESRASRGSILARVIRLAPWEGDRRRVEGGLAVWRWPSFQLERCLLVVGAMGDQSFEVDAIGVVTAVGVFCSESELKACSRSEERTDVLDVREEAVENGEKEEGCRSMRGVE